MTPRAVTPLTADELEARIQFGLELVAWCDAIVTSRPDLPAEMRRGITATRDKIGSEMDADRAILVTLDAARSTPDPAGAGRDDRLQEAVILGLPRQSIRGDGNIGRGEASAGRMPSSGYVEVVSLAAVRAALAQSSDGSLDGVRVTRAEWARLKGVDDIAALIVDGWDNGFPVTDGSGERELIDRLRAARLTEHSDAPDDLGAGQ